MKEITMKHLTLGAAVIALTLSMSAPSFAKEVKELVGYVKTTTINDRDAEFVRMDTSGDGAVNFKEFQKVAILENEYEMFNMNDTNNDDLLSLEEYRVFSKQGPARVSDGPSRTNYNFNKKPMNY